MKKFIGGLCSIAVGICTYIFLGMDFITAKLGRLSSDGVSGYDLIKEKDLESIDGFTLHKIFAIICMVVAGLLILMGLVLILNNMGTIKTKANLTALNSLLLVVYSICAVVTLIANFIFCGNMEDASLGLVEYTPALGVWLFVAVGVVLTLMALLFGNVKAKKKR